jgi:hypothetical protein
VKIGVTLAAAVLCCVSIVPMVAAADPWEVRREMREGAHNVARERHEAAREIRRCESRECVLREVREGHREVNRERREARGEIYRERAGNYDQVARHYRDGRYYGDRGFYRGSGYYGYNNPNAHYHPNGRFCIDASHIVHLRDGYYRGERRWYRDGRYWNENDYVVRYYRDRYRQRDDDGDNDNDDLVRGIVIGAAAVGVIAAIHEANDDD